MTNKIQAARQPRFTFDKNSPLGHFWRWWSGELIALVPQWLRQFSTNATNGLLIEVTPQAVVLQRWVQGSLTEQGRIDRQSGDRDSQGITFQALFSKLHKHDEQVALWLTDTQCLVKQIELPLAAAKNLRQVLGFEMDRHTPFKAEQVYFDFRVLRVDNQKNRLAVKLVVVPRSEMDGSLDLLEQKEFILCKQFSYGNSVARDYGLRHGNTLINFVGYYSRGFLRISKYAQTDIGFRDFS